MRMWGYSPLLVFITALISHTASEHLLENEFTVMIAIIVEQESSYILPQYLGSIDRLSYPKEKITLWLRTTGPHVDEPTQVLNEWANSVKHLYRGVQCEHVPLFEEPNDREDFSKSQEELLLNLKQEALQTAVSSGSDYIMFADSDILLKDFDLLDHLIDASIIHRAQVVAPLISVKGKRYSNFWGALTAEGGYKDSPDYNSISERRTLGCFAVPIVYNIFLVDLKNLGVTNISFNASIYRDNDTNIYNRLTGFTRSVASQGGKIIVCNNIKYGEMSLPVSWLNEGANEKKEYLLSALRKSAYDLSPLPASEYLKIKPSKLSEDFDMVYIINLKKRLNRRLLMKNVLYELGVENYQFFEAVDGTLLNETYLNGLEVKTMDGYEEPFTHRHHLTNGEIGCFLSHFFIWEEALEKGYSKVLILEDDASPIPNMLEAYDSMTEDLNRMEGTWDLLYLGRKIHEGVNSTFIDNVDHLVEPGYSYWCVAYALTTRGLEKLLYHKPLTKMLPTDEYIPILYNQHPNEGWKNMFNPRNLIALSAHPRLIYPSHYPGDKDYLSDTEHIIARGHRDEL